MHGVVLERNDKNDNNNVNLQKKVHFYRLSTDLVVSAGKVRELFPRQLVDALDHLKTWWIHYDMEILLVSMLIQMVAEFVVHATLPLGGWS